MKKKKLIVKSKRVSRWKRDLDAAVKGLKRDAWNALAGLGLVTLAVLIMNWLGGM